MSVQSQIDRIEQNVANTYAVLDALGADMPAAQNSDNLATTAGSAKAVLYSAQNLTDAQKAQARENIGAVGSAEINSEAYKNAIADLVVAHLVGYPVVGVVDEDNNIILHSSLGVGTYTLKYEGANGEYSDIVELAIKEEDLEEYTNVLPLAQEYASEAPYVGTDGSKGYGNGMRLSTSSPTTTYMKALTGVDITAMIPVKRGDVLRFKNCNYKVTPTNTSYGSMIQGFNGQKGIISGFSVTPSNIDLRLPYVKSGDEIVEITLEPKSAWTTSNIDQVAYIMISTDGLDETSIITINQEII